MAGYNNRTKKGVFAAIAVALATALGIGYVAASIATQSWNPAEWVKHPTEVVDPLPGDEGDDGNVQVTIPEGNNGIKLSKTAIARAQYEEYGISPQAESAFTITATVNDTNGLSPDYIQFVEYAMTWKTEKSANITDYIDMSVSGATATFTCKQGFDTQIIVTCTSVITPGVQATATLDYAKRLQGIYFSDSGKVKENPYEDEYYSIHNETPELITDGGTVSGISLPTAGSLPNSDYGIAGMWNNCKFKFTNSAQYGIGTIDNEITETAVTVELAESLATAIRNNNYLADNGAFTPSYTLLQSEIFGGISINDLFTHFYNNITTYAGNSYEFLHEFSQVSNQLKVTVNVTCTYGGSQTISYYLDCNVTPTSAANISLNSTNHIF